MRANPGGEIDQNEVVGRDSFIEAFWGVLAHQSVLLLSERRFGKTTVIKKMKAEYRADWLLLWRDVEGISTALEFAERVFRDIEEYLSKSKRLASKTRAVIGAMGGVEIGGVFKLPPASKLPWKTLLEKSFEDLMEARDSRVVFFWDEMPFMIQKIHDKEGAPVAMDILDSLRGIRQTHRHVRMVFCGSIGMHHVINALQKSGHTNPALNDLFTMPLPPLTSNDGAELARRLIRGESLPCEDLDSTTRALAEAVDPYLHPDTGLLRNLIGVRTQGALDQAEGDLTYIRAAELQERPIRATGDLDEFRAIHRQLFQDVYPWAGEVRTVDLRKNVAGA